MKRLLVVLAASAALASGCDSAAGPAPDNPVAGPPVTLRVLAGSELADLKPILDSAAQATGVRVQFTFSGTLEGAETLAGGKADGKYDAIWFSANRYLEVVPDAKRRLGNQTKIMTSPVVLGLPTSVVTRLGWQHRPVSWSDIAAAAGRHAFSYGMTDPSASNSGFSALVGVASALADSGSALNAAQIEAISPQLREFFAAQDMSAGSSGWLSDAYRRRVTGADPGPKVDGLLNYESVLLSLNASKALPEPLSIVYPSDGVVTADYPLTLLSGGSDQVHEAYQRLTDYLRGPDVQRRIMTETGRRPVVPNVALEPRFGHQGLVELPFPATGSAIDALLTAYFDRIRKPSRTLYLLDTSGSMQGARLTSLKTALTGLTGADTSLVGKYRKFHGREEVTLLPFNTHPGPPTTITVPRSGQSAALTRIADYTGGLKAAGETAIYDSLAKAYEVIAAQGATSDHFTSIVLMTDGENTVGSKLAAFTAAFARYTPAQRAVPVFAVVFGEGSSAELTQVATTTGGKVFDARKTDLGAVFKDIRGYQ